MNEVLCRLLAEAESHDAFIIDLANWLRSQASTLQITGCTDDIYDAASSLDDAAGNYDEDDFDDSMDGDHASGLASAGLGTDEDYGGCLGGDDGDWNDDWQDGE